jgi:hypothetical protein
MIVKVLKTKNGKPQHVFLVDSNHEILEFKTEEEAKKIAEIFETNSDKGWTYYVRKI